MDVLVNDAGVGKHGDFRKVGLNEHLYVVHTNVTALTALTHLFLPQLVKRKGKILNLASIASFQPGPHMAVYYATKAYVKSFSESLAEELKDKGVTVTALAPGPTQTRFDERSGMTQTKAFRNLKVMDAATVAEQGYNALMKGKRVHVPGMQNKVIAASTKAMTSAMRAKTSKKTLEKKR